MKHNNNFFPLESEIPKELLLAEQLEQKEYLINLFLNK